MDQYLCNFIQYYKLQSRWLFFYYSVEMTMFVPLLVAMINLVAIKIQGKNHQPQTIDQKGQPDHQCHVKSATWLAPMNVEPICVTRWWQSLTHVWWQVKTCLHNVYQMLVQNVFPCTANHLSLWFVEMELSTRSVVTTMEPAVSCPTRTRFVDNGFILNAFKFRIFHFFLYFTKNKTFINNNGFYYCWE